MRPYGGAGGGTAGSVEGEELLDERGAADRDGIRGGVASLELVGGGLAEPAAHLDPRAGQPGVGVDAERDRRRGERAARPGRAGERGRQEEPEPGRAGVVAEAVVRLGDRGAALVRADAVGDQHLPARELLAVDE